MTTGPKSKILLILAVVTLFASTAPAFAQQPGVVRLHWDQWQLHIGDDPGCAAIQAPACTTQKYYYDISRYGTEWQRIEVDLPAALRTQRLGLIVQGEDPIYQVFVNGQFVGGSGDFPTGEGPQDSRTLLELPSNLIAGGRAVIAIRQRNVHTSLRPEGFAPAIAPMDQAKIIMDEDTLSYVRASWQHYLCFALLGCVGLVFFLLFSVNTRLREYFWLGALLCLLFSFRIGELGSIVDFGIPVWLGVVCYSVGNSIQTAIIIEFIFSFLGRRVPWYYRIVEVWGALSLTSILPLLHVHFSATVETLSSYSFGFTILIATLTQLILLPTCFRSKLAEMRWIGGAILFLTLVEARWQAGWALGMGFPQYLQMGSLQVDLRPVAWLLFAVVMLIAMTFRLRRIQDRTRAIEQEVAAARSVQQILIPAETPSVPGLAIETVYKPAGVVGGDFFQVLPLPSGGALAVVGDVSGKGMPAAMTVSLLVGTARTLAHFTQSPGEILTEMNHRMLGRNSGGFTTCLVLGISPDGTVTAANAGHLCPYLDGREISVESGLPLGIAPVDSYPEAAFRIENGAQLTLVTDGVVEARDQHGALFGFARTAEISAQPAEAIAHAAQEFGQDDDITVLTLRRVPSTVTAPDPALALVPDAG